ncbi:hypothetical protein [Nannocystis sp. SCPEA4]|nr:hypothetical protein [Nannocystis sp. SCPEA4]MCY1056774.1 hypothetical protein [Nannocystis sp. SCPEA4]
MKTRGREGARSKARGRRDLVRFISGKTTYGLLLQAEQIRELLRAIAG